MFTIEAETGQVFAWGSNKYFQIVPTEVSQSIMGVTNLQLKLEEGEILIPSSYCTLLLSPNRTRGTKLFQKK